MATRDIFIMALVLVAMGAGYYYGKNEGLHQGAIEMRTCVDNGASGWYVYGNTFNCVFD